MHIAKLRQVGGSVMLAIPPALLDQLHLSVRSEVGIAVEGGRLVVEPAKVRPRYKLADLLAQCDPSAPVSDEDREWMSRPPVGEELI